MNDNGGRLEALNQAVRALVTLGLVAGFITGFIVLKLISGEVYTAIVSGVIGYWFAARQGEQAAKAALQALTPTPPPPLTVTIPVPPESGRDRPAQDH